MLTARQTESFQEKIKKLKAVLARDKREWGGYYHDGQGIRYLIPALYVQLEDYKGALRYFNWFRKYFPDDSGYPDFLFEWTLVLFMNGKIRDAEKQLFITFTRNTYVIDKFLGREINAIDKWEGSNLEMPCYTQYFTYSHTEPALSAFSEWLKAFIATEKFVTASEKYIAAAKQLKHEEDGEILGYLISHKRQLVDNF